MPLWHGQAQNQRDAHGQCDGDLEGGDAAPMDAVFLRLAIKFIKALKALDKHNRGGGIMKWKEVPRSRNGKNMSGGTSEKMWRFIIMRLDKISRRRFIKDAGVAALAVAAAGVLAGCSDKSTISTGDDRPITLKYMVTKGGSIVREVTIMVPALADTVTFKTIQENVPAELKDYAFNSTEDKKIPADGSKIVIKMHKEATVKPTKMVDIKYTTGTSPVESANFNFSQLEVDENATFLTQAQLDSLSSENGAYRILNATELFGGMTQNGIIKDGVATVYVEKKN